MKLLIDPVYTSRWMSKCSTYYALKTVAQDFLTLGENRFVYCNVPDSDFNKDFVNDDLVEDDRWLNIPTELGRDRYQSMFYPRNDLMKFGNAGKYWDWDVLLTTRNNGWYWRMISRKQNVDRYRKLLILVEPFPMLSFKTTVSWRGDTDFMILNSYLAFDYVFIQTEWERKAILESAKRLLSPASVMKLSKKIITTFPTPDLDYNYPDQIYKKPSNNLIYVQRLDESERRVSKMLEVVRKSFVVGKDLNVTVTTNSAGIKNYEDTGFVTFKQLPRNEFYDLLKKQTMYLTWSKDEGMPFSLLEADAFGVIPIAKREIWSEDFYGKDYFGLVDSQDEAIMKIRWITENYKEARKRFSKWYSDHRINYVKVKGDQTELQEDFIRKHFDNIASDASKTGDKDYLSKLIDSSEHKKFDMNDEDLITKLDGVRTKKRTLVPIDVPLSRQRDYYPDKIRLMLKHKWREELQPGKFKR